MEKAQGKRVGTKRTTAVRRQDENSELNQLASLLPIDKNKSSVDKISVLRLTAAYVKFRKFLNEAGISWPDPASAYEQLLGTPLDGQSTSDSNSSLVVDVYRKRSRMTDPTLDMGKMINKAMDGFLIVVADDSTVLYVPDYVTEYIGLTQAEIIGQSLFELTHSDDHGAIERNLIYDPSDLSERQWRQFCVRFKTSLNAPRSPLSKFSGHKMIQISGFLKYININGSDSDAFENSKGSDKSHSEEDDSDNLDNIKEEHPKSVGIVGECRPIESMSIVELSIERSSFTTTTTLDLKFTAVESRVRTLTGYDPEELVGTFAYDFFHPSDFKACSPGSPRAVKCRLTLLNQGRVVSPIHRFLTKSGEWVWVQMVCVLSYVPGTKKPFDVKVTFRIVSSEVGKVSLIERTESYKGDSSVIAEPYRLHLVENTKLKPSHSGSITPDYAHFVEAPNNSTDVLRKDILNQAIHQPSLQSNLLETVHHSREFALRSFTDGRGVQPAMTIQGEEPVSLYPPGFPQKVTTNQLTESFLEPTLVDSIPYSSPLTPRTTPEGCSASSDSSLNSHSSNLSNPQNQLDALRNPIPALRSLENTCSSVGSPCPSDSSGFCSLGSPSNGNRQQSFPSPPPQSSETMGYINTSDLPAINDFHLEKLHPAVTEFYNGTGFSSAQTFNVDNLDVDKLLQELVP